jgi:D-2-hydroxyacid dehydrogenase (NADP+)
VATAILVFDPDRPEDAATLQTRISREFPQLPALAAGTVADAIAMAPSASILAAKAQDVSPALVAAMPQLRWIQALTTGIDPLLTLNLPRTVTVTSARGIHGPQMAELALLYMLSLSRDFPRMLANQRRTHWQRWGQRLLIGKTVVIVGVGSISEALASRCQALGLKVIGISARHEAIGFDELHPKDRLCENVARADFLVLLMPYSPETHHLIDAAVLRAMPQSSFLINIARGKVVDEAALIEALTSGHIAGAALDVFEIEPLPKDSPLWALDNVIVTPHIGGMSDIYVEQLVPLLLHNIRAHLSGDLTAMRNLI